MNRQTLIRNERALVSWVAAVALGFGIPFSAAIAALDDDASALAHEIALARWRVVSEKARQAAQEPVKKRAGALNRLRRARDLDSRLAYALARTLVVDQREGER